MPVLPVLHMCGTLPGRGPSRHLPETQAAEVQDDIFGTVVDPHFWDGHIVYVPTIQVDLLRHPATVRPDVYSDRRVFCIGAEDFEASQAGRETKHERVKGQQHEEKSFCADSGDSGVYGSYLWASVGVYILV